MDDKRCNVGSWSDIAVPLITETKEELITLREQRKEQSIQKREELRKLKDIRIQENVAEVEIEAELETMVDLLNAAVTSENTEEIGNICKKITATLGERNRLCKLSK